MSNGDHFGKINQTKLNQTKTILCIHLEFIESHSQQRVQGKWMKSYAYDLEEVRCPPAEP